MKIDWASQSSKRPALLVVILLEFALVLVLMLDWNSRRATPDQSIRTGKVVDRGTVFVGPLSRPLLTIRVDGMTSTVTSILMVNASRQIPSTVSFYFPPPDPSDVQLREETSSLTAALWVSALLVLTLGLQVAISAAAHPSPREA